MSILDLTTIECPWNIIKTKQAMDKLSKGDKLLIKAGGDESFILDCQVYVNRAGHKLLSNWRTADSICCLLQK
jgi:TusA-related sulfurtransferase